MSARILLVEDETAIATLIRFTLEQAGYRVDTVGSTEDACERLKIELPDLILLDWMLPGVSGAAYAKALRADSRTRDLPLIMITARSEEEDKEQGLDAGADDYITKPFSPRELTARIRALLRRRAPQKTGETVETRLLLIDPENQNASTNGRPITLYPSEFKLLHFFATRPGRLYSRRQLLDLVWGDHVFIEERTVDVHIRRLRKALGEHGLEHLIQTVRGSGYRFSEE